MLADNDQYRQLFIEEAKEHIDTLTQSLLALEKDTQNLEVVQVLFRSAHTLKSSSGMMGYKDLQDLNHAMEDIFDGMQKGNRPSSNLISVLLECVDALSLKLENIQNRVEGEINVASLTEKLQGAAVSPLLEEPEEAAAVPQTKIVESTFIELDENEKEAIATA